MNRASARSRLRRRINEATADYWEDPDLNDLLQAAAVDVQTKLLMLNPLCMVQIHRATLKPNENFYSLPIGSWWEKELAVRWNNAATTYTVLKPAPYKELRSAESSAEPAYARLGRFYYIAPAPQEEVVAGLQIIHTPVVSWAADTEVPEIPLAFHTAVLVKAHMMALKEGAEHSPLYDELKAEWEEEQSKFPLVTLESMAELPHLSLELGR